MPLLRLILGFGRAGMQFLGFIYESSIRISNWVSFWIFIEFLSSGYCYSARAIKSNGSATVLDSVTPKKKKDEEESPPESWKIKMLYDGDCPLCMREVCLMQLIFHMFTVFFFFLAIDLKFCSWIENSCAEFILGLLIFQVNMLRERNKNYATIKFVDISSKEYSPEENQGLDYETVCVIQHC